MTGSDSEEAKKSSGAPEATDKKVVVAATNLPPLGIFSGQVPTPKNELDYTSWKLQVEAAIEEEEYYPPRAVRIAVRKSCRGLASQIINREATSCDVHGVLEVLDSYFGEVQSADIQWSAFFNARQEPSESIAEWASRITGCAHSADDADSSNGLTATALEKRIIMQFWKNLHSEKIKEALRQTVKTKGLSLRDLMAEARSLETEFKTCKPKKTVMAVAQSTDKPQQEKKVAKQQQPQAQGKGSGASNMEARMAKMEETISTLTTAMQNFMASGGGARKQSQGQKGACHKCHKYGHFARECTEVVPSPVVCYTCGMPDHKSPRCPLDVRNGGHLHPKRYGAPAPSGIKAIDWTPNTTNGMEPGVRADLGSSVFQAQHPGTSNNQH